MFKTIVGSFHQISRKHMDAYLDEFEWHFNNCENPFLFRDTLSKLLESPKQGIKATRRQTNGSLDLM